MAGLRLKEEETTRGLAQAAVVGRTVPCFSIHTRPVSWLGPASSGTHPRTKGARCFAGGRRRRIPSTAKGLLIAGVETLASHQGTLRGRQKTPDQQNAQDAIHGRMAFLPCLASRAWQGAHTVGRLACWIPRCTNRTWGGVIHGLSGGANLACRMPDVCSGQIQPAKSLCIPGNDCTTRTRRSCRFADGSPRRRVDRLAPAAA